MLDELARTHASPAWAFIRKVRNATGYSSFARTADAVAMSLWPSRGLDLWGFEVKVSRGDWLAELRQPEKADEIAAYCDFWAVAAPKGVVLQGEAPAKWGVAEVSAGRVRWTKPAERLTPAALDRGFVAAILRRATEDVVPRGLVDSAVDAKLKKCEEEWEDRKSREDRKLRSDLKEMQDDLKAFEEASGVVLRHREWEYGRIGAAVRIVMDAARSEHIMNDLEAQAAHLKGLADLAASAAAEIRKASAYRAALTKPQVPV